MTQLVVVDARKHGDKAAAIAAGAARRLPVDIKHFESIPGTPFAYWAPRALLAIFARAPRFDDGPFLLCRTNSLDGDFRYARCSWEVDATSTRRRWFPWAKGGDFAAYYQDLPMVIGWDVERGTYPGFLGTRNRPLARPASSQHFFRPGLTWSRRTQRGLSFRAQQAGVINGDKGPFVGSDLGDEALLAVLAVVNSSAFLALVETQMAFGSYEVGVVQQTPLPPTDELLLTNLAELCSKAWSRSRSQDAASERSHAFVLPWLLSAEGPSLAQRCLSHEGMARQVEDDLTALRGEIDVISFELYQIPADDRVALRSSAGAHESADHSDSSTLDGEPPQDSGLDLAAGLVSWCVGVGVCRFDVRLATGEREWPVEPDPFDPLPVCSPGMLTGEDGLPLEVPPEGYPVEVSPVLVDDPGHRLDITGRVRSVFDVVFDDPDAWWTDVGEALGAKRGEIGSWLSKGFFDHHLKTYSKSRRRAPILWPLGTASGSYVVWLYAHRVTSDSLFRVLNDVVSPKLGVERRGLSELVQEAGPNPSAGERKAIDAQEKLVGELEELVEQLSGVAPLWHPDLNDGVVIVLAPLWRLFVHHKAWSKELRKHWNSLVAGDYDWAQLAMHLWPERVVPKCVDDRSLAIAHGLEDVFWVQDDDNNPDKWHPRQTPNVPIEDLIAERTDPATKAALEDAT